MVYTYEVQLYNVDSNKLIAKCQLMSKINCLQWTRKLLDGSQILLAGQEDGKIAVLKVQGDHMLSIECISYLNFHKAPLMFI